MRLPTLVALTVLLAGCSSPGGEDAAPANALPSRDGRLLPASATLDFGEPVVALDGCGVALLSPSLCYEPSVVDAGEGRILAANGYGGLLARSDDGGATWIPLAAGRPTEQPLAAGGDALLQRAPDGRLWHSALLQTSVTVSATADGGLTWSPNTIARFGAPVDRNWVGFGKGVVTLHVQGEEGARVVASRDGGATWGEPILLRPSPVIHGQPATTPTGRILLPTLASEFAVFASADGSTWERIVVSDRSGDFFPAIVAGEGRVVAAWKRGTDVWLATSPDEGATWSAPIVGNLPGERVAVSPWLVERDGVLALIYLTAEDPNAPADQHAVRIEEDAVARGIVARGIALNGLRDERPGNTDMAHGDLLPDGRLVTTFADEDGALRVAVQR